MKNKFKNISMLSLFCIILISAFSATKFTASETAADSSDLITIIQCCLDNNPNCPCYVDIAVNRKKDTAAIIYMQNLFEQSIDQSKNLKLNIEDLKQQISEKQAEIIILDSLSNALGYKIKTIKGKK